MSSDGSGTKGTQFSGDEPLAAHSHSEPSEPAGRSRLRKWLKRCAIALSSAVIIGLTVAVIVDQNRDDEPARAYRAQIVAGMRDDATSVQLTWATGYWYVMLDGEDARMLGLLARNELVHDRSTQGFFNRHRETVYFAVWHSPPEDRLDASSSKWGVRMFLDSSGSIYLDEVDTWFDGSPEFAFLLNLIFRTRFLEEKYLQRYPDSELPVSASEIEHFYDDAVAKEAVSWRVLPQDQVGYVRSWIKRYNAVSSRAPLDEAKLFPSK